MGAAAAAHGMGAGHARESRNTPLGPGFLHSRLQSISIAHRRVAQHSTACMARPAMRTRGGEAQRGGAGARVAQAAGAQVDARQAGQFLNLPARPGAGARSSMIGSLMWHAWRSRMRAQASCKTGRPGTPCDLLQPRPAPCCSRMGGGSAAAGAGSRHQWARGPAGAHRLQCGSVHVIG